MFNVIAIIGGGFSGTVPTLNLLRQYAAARIVLIERAASIGRGIACAERHVPFEFNVPAGRLLTDSRAAEPRHPFVERSINNGDNRWTRYTRRGTVRDLHGT